jgi:hypothetical protein
MTTIELSDEQAAALNARAAAQGLTLKAWLSELAQSAGPRSLQDELSPEEWIRQFGAWVQSHDRTTPLLSDEAINRESIYPDPV